MNDIAFTPPKAVGKTHEELTQHIDTMHQLIFNKFQNHFEAIKNQQAQIEALQAEVKALQKK
jgi:LytS/YehU family sensor histidine kinase